MKLHLPKSLLVAALVAMSAVSSFAAEYTVGTITTSHNFPSSSGNIWTPGTADGSLTLGTGDWLGAKDANGNRITSFGTQKWDYSGFIGIGGWTQKNNGTVTQNAQFSTLTINGGAQVVLGGQYVSTKVVLGTTAGSMAEYTGVIADHVVVNGDGSTTNLNTWNLTTDTLVVNSGKVEIHNQVQHGNNHFVYELRDSKQVRIHEGLTVKGGEVIINLNSLNSTDDPNSNPNDIHIFTGFGTINFDAPSYEEGAIVDASKASIVKSWITQSDGSLVIQGKTASVGGLNINQTGGTMSVSTNADGTGSHCWHILSDFGDSTINQGGDADTVLNIGGIAAYNSKYSDIKGLMADKGVVFDPLRNEAEYNGEVMDLNASVSIEQTGSGTINIIQGIDLNNYHENKNGVASTQSSTITQSGSGVINLGGTYKGASFDIIQNGNGGVINLKGSMNGGTISQSAGTLNIGTTDKDGNVLTTGNMTANSVSIGGKLNVVDGASLKANTITVTDNGSMNVANLNVDGTLTNNGTVQAAGQVTATGTVDNKNNMEVQTLVINSGTTTNAKGAKLTAGSILVDGGTLVNYGTISSDNGSMMLTAEDDVAAMNDTAANLITIARGDMKQFGTTTSNILVQAGGSLTLGVVDGVTTPTSVGAVTLEDGANMKVEGNSTTGALTLEGGTITFEVGASLSSTSASGLDKVEIKVNLSDAALEDLKAGKGYAGVLFTVSGDNSAVLNGTSIKFQSQNAGSYEATVKQDSKGKVTIGALVPEPTTATLSLLALAALAARRRRAA